MRVKQLPPATSQDRDILPLLAPSPAEEFGSNADMIDAMAKYGAREEPDSWMYDAGGYGEEGEDEDSFDAFEEDTDYDYSDSYDYGYGYGYGAGGGTSPHGVGEEHPVPANRTTIGRQWVSPEGLRVKGMGTNLYMDETKGASFRGDPRIWSARHNESLRPGDEAVSFDHIFTHYLDDQEIASATLGVSEGEDGLARLTDGAGQRLDTRAASGIGTQLVGPEGQKRRSGEGRYIYAMLESGEMRALDPWEARKVNARGGERPGHELGFINHSSLTRGGGAAGAGDLVVEDGRVTEISNNSGHYRPDVGMLFQATEALAARGVLGLTGEGAASAKIHAGKEEPESFSALSFLAASEWREDVARERFGTEESREKVRETLQERDYLHEAILRRRAAQRGR